jgi:multidrug efflux pump subunit AcrB
MKPVLTAIVGNNVLANVVLVAIILVGVLAASSLVRESLPQFPIGLIFVEVPFPGADPEEVEEGVSQRIEAAIDGLEGIKQYTTGSWEGRATVEIEVADGFDVGDVKDEVQNAIDAIDTFPARVERPRVSEIKDQEFVIALALYGDVPERQLKEWAEDVRDRLQRSAGISLVDVGGTRSYEIAIEISKSKLLEYGLTLDEVGESLRRGSLNLPAGTIRTEGEDIRIRMMGRKYTGREFANIVIRSSMNGDLITLDKIATIHDGFVESPAYSSFNGHPCVIVEVIKAPGEDALTIAQYVREFAMQERNSLPPQLHVEPCFDESEFVRGQLNLLARNGIIGLILVVSILWFFLNSRLSFWIAMGIPISISGALILMWALGQTINQISLITFIIVLGIIVDDAIVVGESIFVHRRRGKPPLQAAVDGVCEMGGPVIAAVLTTIVAFLPLAFVPGILGKIIVIMPIVVISALLISLVECLFLLPAHLNHLPAVAPRARSGPAWKVRAARIHEVTGHALEAFAERIYAPFARKVVRHRYVTLCVAMSVVLATIGLVGGKVIRVVFWPPVDGNTLRALVEFPAGTSPEVTRDAVEQTRQAFQHVAERTTTESGDPLIRNVYTNVYENAPHLGRVVVEMIGTSKRGVHSQELAAAWEREVGAIPGAVQQSFVEDQVGMGGSPIEIWLHGKDLDALRAAAEELKDKLREYDGVFQVAGDLRSGTKELRVRLKPEAHTLGLTLDQVARQLYAGYYGEEAIRLQRGRDDMRVRVRYPEDERQTLAELDLIRVRTPSGMEVPFRSVADIELAEGVASIKGSNGLRRIAVTASADVSRANPSDIVAELSDAYLDDLAARYGQIVWSVEGVEESNQETLAGLKEGFLIALLGIYTILAVLFRSYIQPLIVLTIVPFGIVGALFGHLALGIPVTFLSLFGIVALAGVVVNDSIVLTECVNNLLAEGTSFLDAVCMGGVRRFRAIFLTTASTCIGLTPLILERDLQAQVVIPMAVSIAAGVAFSTLLTLLFLPAMLAIVNDLRRALHRVLTGNWPTPEQVEPGAKRMIAAAVTGQPIPAES